MFSASSVEVERMHSNPAEGNEISDVVKKKDGMAFNLEFKAALPAKLPPIKVTGTSSRIVQEDYKWKETKDKELMEKLEKAKIRREAVLEKRKIAAKRPKTAQHRDSNESDSFEE
ncbi:uncharacterized protein LOC134240203 [Saccostrea cucullata]|uniref:uncharacterized protein LOC134240203 n=1 Tax=Saccostrea cuccullata TaxID=36930 RepID=UPI002ED5ABFA